MLTLGITCRSERGVPVSEERAEHCKIEVVARSDVRERQFVPVTITAMANTHHTPHTWDAQHCIAHSDRASSLQNSPQANPRKQQIVDMTFMRGQQQERYI